MTQSGQSIDLHDRLFMFIEYGIAGNCVTNRILFTVDCLKGEPARE